MKKIYTIAFIICAILANTSFAQEVIVSFETRLHDIADKTKTRGIASRVIVPHLEKVHKGSIELISGIGLLAIEEQNSNDCIFNCTAQSPDFGISDYRELLIGVYIQSKSIIPVIKFPTMSLFSMQTFTLFDMPLFFSFDATGLPLHQEMITTQLRLGSSAWFKIPGRKGIPYYDGIEINIEKDESIDLVIMAAIGVHLQKSEYLFLHFGVGMSFAEDEKPSIIARFYFSLFGRHAILTKS